ncbi:MAG: VOC family protein [Pyrinomonadaceae bacterium]
MKHHLSLINLILALFLTAGSVPGVFGQKFTAPSTKSEPGSTRDRGRIKTATLSIYILFQGNCKEAMEFYHSVFGGHLTQTKVGSSPMKRAFPEHMYDKIINARLVGKNVDISASDWLRPAQNPIQGNMVCLYLSGGKPAELKAIFERLSVGAEVTDPLMAAPFGFYGALNDRFGVRWMFQTDQID